MNDLRRTSRLKTYSRLSREKRMPSEYELVTTDLVYYVGRGFEVTTPISDWYAKYQSGSALVASDWERFVDPRGTTYTKYTELSQMRETYVDGIFQSIEDNGYDRTLSEDWRATLDHALSPLCFALHGFQMIAAYVGQMAPSGRITVAATFQTADEVRRVQRIAYRIAQLRLVDPAFGAAGGHAWQHATAWQPLRESVERCLVTFDWAEALVALNLCLKPIIDELFMIRLPELARSRNDFLLGQIFGSLDEDCRWHREWTTALLETATRDNGGNLAVIETWANKWGRLALRSARALEPLVGDPAGESLSNKLAGLFRRMGLGALQP